MPKKKYNLSFVTDICKNVYNVFYNVFTDLSAWNLVFMVVFIWVLLLAIPALIISMLVKILLESFFKDTTDYIEEKTSDHPAFRVAIVIVLAPIILFKYAFVGFVNGFILFAGLLYDLSNKAISLGQSQSLFIQWGAESQEKSEPIEEPVTVAENEQE